MKKQGIIDAIDNRSRKDYSLWRIGVTSDSIARKKEHENKGRITKYWKQWKITSPKVAKEIESYFIIEKGMRGGLYRNLNKSKKVYVYIF